MQNNPREGGVSLNYSIMPPSGDPTVSDRKGVPVCNICIGGIMFSSSNFKAPWSGRLHGMSK